MRIAEHRRKAARILDSMRRRLDWNADYELCVEACMLAGTHLLNASLHRRGITKEADDLLHSNKPPLKHSVPGDIDDMMAALKVIEDMRPGFLRGNKQWSEADGESCRRGLARVQAISEGILDGEGAR